MIVYDVQDLHKTYPGQEDPANKAIDLQICQGEIFGILGPNGSGKSTLLSAIAGVIDVPEGSVSVADTDVGKLTGGQRDRFRVDHLGIIFQVFNLLPC